MAKFKTDKYKQGVARGFEAGYTVDDIASAYPQFDLDAIQAVYDEWKANPQRGKAKSKTDTSIGPVTPTTRKAISKAKPADLPESKDDIPWEPISGKRSMSISEKMPKRIKKSNELTPQQERQFALDDIASQYRDKVARGDKDIASWLHGIMPPTAEARAYLIDAIKNPKFAAEPSTREFMLQGLLSLTPIPYVNAIEKAGTRAVTASKYIPRIAKPIGRTAVRAAVGATEGAAVNAGFAAAIGQPVTSETLMTGAVMGGAARAVLGGLVKKSPDKLTESLDDPFLENQPKAKVESTELLDDPFVRADQEKDVKLDEPEPMRTTEASAVEANKASDAAQDIKPDASTNAPVADNVTATKQPLEALDPTKLERRSYAPEEVKVDPEIQWKKRGIVDAENQVTGEYKNVTEYDTAQAGPLVTWERTSGDTYIAHGHHRLDIAKRAKRFVRDVPGENGLVTQEMPSQVEAYVLRESDGWTKEKVRGYSALLNIRDGKGSPIDAVAVIRDLGYGERDLARIRIAPGSAMYRDVKGLMKLSDQSLEQVRAGDIPESVAGGIGEYAQSPESQAVAIRSALDSDLSTFDQGARVAKRAQDNMARRADSGQIKIFGNESDNWVDTSGIQVKIEDGVTSLAKRYHKELAGGLDLTLLEGEQINRNLREELASAVGNNQAQIKAKLAAVYEYDGSVRDAIRKQAERVANNEIGIPEAVANIRDAAVESAKRPLAEIVTDGEGQANRLRERNAHTLEPAVKPRRVAAPETPNVAMQDVNENILISSAQKAQQKGRTINEWISTIRGSGTQYGEYNPAIRATIKPYEKSARLSELGIDPELDVTIYRGVPDPKTQKIVSGDFVTTDKLSAENYTGGDVVSKKVKAKDIVVEHADEFDVKHPFYEGSEFIYSDSKNKLTHYTDSQLKSIWERSSSNPLEPTSEGTFTEPYEQPLLHTQEGGHDPMAGTNRSMFGADEVPIERVEKPVAQKPVDEGLFGDGKSGKSSSSGGVLASTHVADLPTTSSLPPVNIKKPATTPAKIQKALAKVFAPIRTGRLHHSRMAAGEYHVIPGGIRIKQYGDIPTIAHEVGHHLHKLIFPDVRTPKGNLSAKAFPKEYWPELAPMAYPGAKGKVIEGYAEFMRLWLTDPAKASSRAPRFYEHFDSVLKKYPNVAKELVSARDNIKAWIDTPDAMKVRATVSHDEPTLKRPITLDSIAVQFIDNLRPLQRATESMAAGKELPATRDPYKTAWMARASGGKAQTWIEHGPMDAQNNVIGQSLKSILEPISQDVDLFADYLVAKHAQEITTPMPLSKATYKGTLELVENRGLTKAFEHAGRQIGDYQNNLLDLLVDSGVVDPVQAKQWRTRHKHYVPLYRVYDERLGVGQGTGKGFETRSPIQRRKGSGRPIINPIESIIKNTFIYHDVAARHAVMRSLYDLAKTSEGSARWVEIVPLKKKPTTIRVGDVLKVDEHNPLWFDIFSETGMTPEDAVTIFKPNARGQASDNVVQLYIEGKPVQLRLDAELYNAVTAFDAESAGLAIKLMELPAKTLRTGATLAPEFPISNVFRDAGEAMIYSKSGINPLDIAKGVFHALKKDDLYYKYLNSSGGFSSMMATDRGIVQSEIARLTKRAPKDRIKAWSTAPLEQMRELFQPFEEGTRLAEFSKSTRGGIEKDVNALMEAGLASRDITIDFRRSGTVGKKINRVTAFFNAGIQGGSKLAREIRTNPQRFMRRGLTYITAPTIALYMMNKDNPEYDRLNEWEKDYYWHVFVDETHVRIPKPFGLGTLFGAVPERIMRRAVTDDPHAFDNLASTLSGAFVPTIIPTLLIPYLAIKENKSFAESPIVPKREERLPPEMQYGPQTSGFSRIAGKAVNISPRKIDYLVQGYTGGLGNYLWRGLSAVAESTGIIPVEPKPTLVTEQYPIVKRFTSNPYSGSVYTERLYDEKTKLDQKKTLAQDNESKFSNADARRLKELTLRTDALSGMRKVERGIQSATTMDALDKWENHAMLNPTSGSINDRKRDLLLELARTEDILANGEDWETITMFRSLKYNRAINDNAVRIRSASKPKHYLGKKQ